ncbi:winged helix-turn-helix domain-containing protein [Haladaptatus sp. NG-WS-4]
MTSRPDWMRPVDVKILVSFKRMQPEYIPLVANRLGIHLSYAERRCELLTDHALIAPVTEEAVYRVTDRGEALLTEVQQEET